MTAALLLVQHVDVGLEVGVRGDGSRLAQHLPALDLLAELAALSPFALCEGGIAAPVAVRTAFASGASAVVVGTAITNIDWLVRAFAQAARGEDSTSCT